MEQELRGEANGERPICVAPELAVEILSSVDRELALQIKLRDYSAIGVQECWVVRPESRTAAVMCATHSGFKTGQTYGTGEAAHSRTCQNLAVAVDELLSP